MRLIVQATRAREQKEREARMARLFDRHQATIVVADPTAGITVMRWKEPNNSHAAITYTLSGGNLIVTGDLYDAVYCAGIRTLESWASCNLDYFASKCQASPYGRRYREWDPEAAWLYVRDVLAHDAEFYPERRAKWRELTAWYEWPLGSQFEWTRFLHEHGSELFGDDYYEVANAGMRISWECDAHLEGLKRAVAQLRAAAPAAEVADHA